MEINLDSPERTFSVGSLFWRVFANNLHVEILVHSATIGHVLQGHVAVQPIWQNSPAKFNLVVKNYFTENLEETYGFT